MGRGSIPPEAAPHGAKSQANPLLECREEARVSGSRWNDWVGLGVAGNFAGHLEQAGEANDFKDLAISDARAPKGVFPFYVPNASNPGGSDHFLHADPLSSTTIELASPDERHQIEPEVALLCDLDYEGDVVVGIIPREAFAHNDCSIRREGAKKISEKKNWGPASKGTATDSVRIDRFESGGVLDRVRIASYLIRDGQLTEYGIDSEAASYSYMYGELIGWLIDRLNEQKDEGPLECISDWLAVAGHPPQALISIGATRYTKFGETTFLEKGDHAVVALYDASRYDSDAIRERALRAAAGEPEAIDGISLLCQEVV